MSFELNFIWIGLGIAAAGYFIGNGLRNFKNPILGMWDDDEDDSHRLLKDSMVHQFIGIPKTDAEKLVEEYPDIPHLVINGTVYYPKGKLREWLARAGK